MRRSLTKNQILRFKTDIDGVFKAGKRYTLSCFKLLVKDNGLSYSRLIVIPVKNYGNSVQRNKIRRRVKEIWRLHQDSFRTGVDFVIVVYPNEHSYEQLEELILRLMEKSGMSV